jgi:CRISPR/Cas system CSM-associated protein Csm4 (group 5 of RAMP superfamily)
MKEIVYYDYLSHIKYVLHQFGKTDTIYGAIMFYNYGALSENEYNELMSRFNEMNNWGLPKVGNTYKVPVLLRHVRETNGI